SNQRNGVIVSEAFATANKLDVGETFGAVINGRWEKLQITGVAISPEYVYEIRGGDVFPDNRRFGVMWMSRASLGPVFNMEGAFNDVALALAPGGSEAEVISRLDTLLEPYGGLGAYGRRDQLSARFLSDEIAQDRITGIFIPAIFLGVAAFLINVVLSRLVATQRSAIGLLKAFGYSNTSIGFHYLLYSLFAVLLGTVAGVPAGVWLGSGLAKVYEDFFRFPELHFMLSPGMIVAAILISAGAACFGAISALRSTVGLPAAEAMRPEGPARFRAGIAERLGIQRFVPLSARMILRNLERRPWKALLSVIALSLAGVMRIESFRTVPARLRFEYRSKRVAITGLEPDAELRRLIDLRLRPVGLPLDGIVISANLASALDIKPGQMLTVEVLEGERPVRQAVVAQVVDDLIGTSAYMDIGALNRLMREGSTTSGAFLLVDALVADRLYSILKRTPAVSGVTVREAMLTSFRETIARSLTISVGALIGFACMISVGTVYNGARISFSERAYEL